MKRRKGRLWYRKGDSWFFDWRNFLTPKWQDALFLVIVLFLVLFYVRDTSQCEMVIGDPVGWCNASGACRVMESEGLEVVEVEDLRGFVEAGDS